MDKKKQLNIGNLRRTLQILSFSGGLSGNALAIMKEDLVEAGFRDFPVITFIGAPGTGKTTLARSCTVIGETGEYLFTDKLSDVKKKLKGHPDGYYLIDDCACFAAGASREKERKFLDEIVRSSYSGEFPVLIITMETAVLSQLTPSCRQRLLEIPVDELLKSKTNREWLEWLSKNKDLLQRIFSEFSDWYSANRENIDFREELSIFREKYSGKNPRSTSVFFAYYIAMHTLSKFFKNCYGFEIAKIQENMEYLWKKREMSVMTREDTVVKIMNQLIENRTFHVVKPQAKEICKYYCSGRCPIEISDDYGNKCNGISRRCYYVKEGYYYNPKDLYLDTEPYSALLISHPEQIYQYPDYCSRGPLLIVNDDELLALFNSELDKYCTANKLEMLAFRSKELHKTLFEKRLCMYKNISKNHKVYIFRYETYSGENISVIILRLSQEQYEMLSEVSERSSNWSHIANYERYNSFRDKLNEMGSTIQCMLGGK